MIAYSNVDRTNQWVCPSCGTSVDGDFDVCWKCQADRASVPPATRGIEAEADAQPIATLFDASELPLQENGSILVRYQDGYRVAKLINGFGQACKVVSIGLGGLIALVCIGSRILPENYAIVIGLVFGIIVGFVGWAIGVVISAQGQIVK